MQRSHACVLSASHACILPLLLLLDAGCGASKSLNTAPLVLEQQRDAEDYALEPIQLQTTNIEEFDAVFSRLCTQLNRLIELNNVVHHSVADIKAAFAPLSGGYELSVTFAPSTDMVLLDLRSWRGTNQCPAPHAVAKLLQDPLVQEADRDLEAARGALHEHLASISPTVHVPLKVTRDGALTVEEGTPAPPQVEAFNVALAKLRQVTSGVGYVSVAVKPALACGTNTVRASMVKGSMALWRTALVQPCTLLDLASKPQGRMILEAEAFLVDRAQHLAHRIKGLEVHWEVVANCHIVPTAPLPHTDTQQQVDKLVSAINMALFRMLNSGASVGRPASLSNAVAETVRPALDALVTKHMGTPMASKLKVGSWDQIRSIRSSRKEELREGGAPRVEGFRGLEGGRGRGQWRGRVGLVSLRRLHSVPGPPTCSRCTPTRGAVQSLVSIEPAVFFHRDDEGVPPSFDFQFNVKLAEGAGVADFPQNLTERVRASVCMCLEEGVVLHVGSIRASELGKLVCACPLLVSLSPASC
jgi:hypothetical protein